MAAVLAAELPGLPEGGPATLPGVKDAANVTDDREDRYIGGIVAAVNRKVRRMRIAAYASGTDDWPEDIVLGATMLAARLYRRRNSPAGFEAFNGEGAAYVQRNDPDIAQMLELGPYAGPRIG